MKFLKFILSAVVVASAMVMVSCGSSTKFDPEKVKAIGEKPATEITADDFQVLADQFEIAVKDVQAAKLEDMDKDQQQEWLKEHEDLLGTVIGIPMILAKAQMAGNEPPAKVQEQFLKLEKEFKDMPK